MSVRVCELLFGRERGGEIQRVVLEATGAACPSEDDCASCPLVRVIAAPIVIPVLAFLAVVLRL